MNQDCYAFEATIRGQIVIHLLVGERQGGVGGEVGESKVDLLQSHNVKPHVGQELDHCHLAV